jgi:AraC-like DNA-binding protein
MDPLSEIVALLRPSTAVAKPITGRGRWGVRYTAHGAPGFTIILRGACWITLAGKAPMLFQEGDFLLLPSAPAFSLASHPGIVCTHREPMNAPVRHGEQEGEPDFVSLGGTFRIAEISAPLLLSLLPDVIHIRASQMRTDRIGRVIQLVMDECAVDDPGKELILQRLLEVLLVESLRWRSLDADNGATSFFDGMRDPSIARVLRAMHGDVRAGWTVSGLAEIAGMSRSAFAARFSATLGCGPIEYLARWRMALAKDALIGGVKTLDRIAGEIGYESASAFSTAFRKRLGCSPGRFATSARRQYSMEA